MQANIQYIRYCRTQTLYISYSTEAILNHSLHFYIIRANLLYQQKETS